MLENEDESTHPAADPETAAGSSPRRTPERVADVALGAGATAFDWLEKAAKGVDDAVRRLVDDAPAVLEELEERGRPVREKLGEWLPGRHPGAQAPTPSENTARAAEDDIALLEARVRELERQVPAPDTADLDLSDVPSSARGEVSAGGGPTPDPMPGVPDAPTDATIAPGPDDAPAADPESTA